MRKLIPDKSKPKEYPIKQITECDRCGKPDDFNAVNIKILWGYGSEYDGDEIKIDLCADCQKFATNLRKNILKKFKGVKVSNYFEI